jgi:hypothetical protein
MDDYRSGASRSFCCLARLEEPQEDNQDMRSSSDDSLHRELKSVERVAFGLTVVLLGWMLVLNAQNVGAGQEEAKNISFRWAFGALTGNDKNLKLEPVTRDRALATGDRLKMMVELQKEGFVYVIYFGGQDQVKLLFPSSLSQFTTDYQVGKRYYIPQGGAWFELDQNVGSEAFHLLASFQRLKGLEAFLTQYEAAGNEQKPAIAKQILAEIRDVKKQNRDFASAAERPVNIGGNIRGLDKPQGVEGPDVASIAQEITGGGFFSRTFTIEHR